MRNKIHLYVLLCCLALLLIPSFAYPSDPSVTANAYLCIPDMATGFSFDKQRQSWSDASFRTDSKYIVTRSSDDLNKWEVKRSGLSSPLAVCEKDFDSYGSIFCKEGMIVFRMNRTNLRFLAAHLYGYWLADVPGVPEGFREEVTPALEIGKCTPF